MYYYILMIFSWYLAMRMKKWDWVEKDALASAFMHMLIIGGAFFGFFDTYNYFILPDNIAKFYPNGGITFSNLTIFNASDEAVLYYISYQKDNHLIVEMVKNYTFSIYILFLTFFMIWWFYGHNVVGEKFGKPTAKSPDYKGEM